MIRVYRNARDHLFVLGKVGHRRGALLVPMIGPLIVAALLVGQIGVGQNTQLGAVATFERLGAGHLSVSPLESFSSGETGIPQSTVDLFLTIPGVTAVYSQFTGDRVLARLVDRSALDQSVSPGGPTWPVIIINGNPTADPLVETISGRWMHRDEFAAVMTPGQSNATNYAVRDGGLVTIGGVGIPVVGVFNSDLGQAFGGRNVLISPRVAADLGYGARNANEVIIAVSDLDIVDTIVERVYETVDVGYPDLRISVYTGSLNDANTEIGIGLGRSSLILTLAVVLVGMMTQVLLTLQNIRHRRNEIGVRMILGHSFQSISAVFRNETLILGTIGASIGALIGTALTILHAQSTNVLPTLSLPILIGTVVFVVAVTSIGATLVVALSINDGAMSNMRQDQ
ncbi:hypothetical protein MNBD_ACTINO02-3161 [hydrothermal vent metagenome]|uniref:ABC3 transporter permease C-terminal domain-containing protein n=1 Tax=hydrothermal vent metagenome TaxID=652676 RepID=A0A3B0REG9_9ZZZZ